MEIKCENCGAVYELDDSMIPEQGLPVQCPECGHIFIARKKKPKPTVVKPVVLQKKKTTTTSQYRYKMRRPNGKEYPFKDMATLHRWIIERKASPMDEITEDGVNWVKLQDIPELEPFFKAVAAMKQGTGQFRKEAQQGDVLRLDHAIRHEPTDSGVNAAPTVQMPQVQAPQPQPQATPRGTLIGPGVPPAPQQQPPQTANTQQVPQAVAPQQQPQPQPQTQTMTPQTPQTPQSVQQMPPAQSQAFSGTPNQQVISQPQGPTTWQPPQQVPETPQTSAEDDEEFWEEYERLQRGKWKKFVIALIVLVVIGLGVWYGVAPKSFKRAFPFIFGPSVPQLAVDEVAKAKELLFMGDEQSLDKAVNKCNSAQQLAEDYIDAYAVEAQAFASASLLVNLHTDWLRTRYNTLKEVFDKLPPTDPKKLEIGKQVNALAPRIEQNRVKAKQFFNQAKDAANKAYQLSTQDSKPPEVLLALAFAAAAGNDSDEMNKFLQQLGSATDVLVAARASFVRGVQLLRLSDKTQLENAVRHLQQALEKKADFAAAYYFLGLAYLKEEKPEKAKEALAKLLSINGAHKRGKEILATLTEAKPSNKKEEKQEAKAEQKPKQAPEKKSKTEPKKVRQSALGFAGLIAKSKRLRMNDRPEKAIEYARRALEMRPDDPRAHIEMGYCLLDLDRIREARKHFFKAYKKAPTNADAVLGIAVSFEAENEVSRAVKWYKKFLNLCPTCEDAPAARQYINTHEDEE